MLSIEELDNEIEVLENSSASFANCQKLASLYICREHIKNSLQVISEQNDKIVKEYSDILPEYSEYCEIKRKFQKGELSEHTLINAMERVCKEIFEFIQSLYCNTETTQERQIIMKLSNDLQKIGK